GISLLEKIWRILISLSAIISAIYIPVRLVLPLGNQYIFEVFDWVFTVIFAIDFFLNAFSITKSESEIEEKTMAKSTWLAIDFLAFFPFVLFGGVTFYMIRLIKLFRIGRFMHEWKRNQIKFSDYLSFSFFLFWLLITSHWLACGWLAQTKAVQPDNAVATYVTALYWVIQTLTTVGYGDVPSVTTGQKIYTIVVMLFGAGVYGYIIGSVASILSQQDPSKAYYTKNIDRLKAFVKYRKLPIELQNKIKNYYTYAWKRRLGFDESSLLTSLPPALKIETALFLKKDMLDKIPIFDNAPDNFKQEVALNFRSMVFSPGDLICREGEIGSEMYFIIQGELEVISGDGKKTIAVLRDGNFFGEISLFKNSPRTANVKAVTYSDLYILEKKIFEQILSRFPSVAEQLQAVANERNEEFK
ncbi:MAG: cyclic nucleotide-binding domain-containing protein, partial [Ignavibacteriaceae bacterium]|nr:cyclic nucleotide-binding domain-containing protein [Ignavibacteriaceae bacterium]